MIEDWEVGELFWRMVDKGHSHEEATQIVKDKLLKVVCGEDKDTYFYVGTILEYPTSWVIVGVFYPKKAQKKKADLQPSFLTEDDFL